MFRGNRYLFGSFIPSELVPIISKKSVLKLKLSIFCISSTVICNFIDVLANQSKSNFL